MKRKRGRPSALSLAAQLMGRQGGLIGGKARAAALTPEQRQEISRQGGLIGGKRSLQTMSARARRERAAKAAAARWGKELHA